MRTILFVCILTVVNLMTESVQANTTTMTTSWYGPGLQGNHMANGERFDMRDPTVAAHKELPFGTELELVNPENGRVITVTIQDRGPFISGRDLDVSRAAAERLGFIDTGVTDLIVTILD